MDYDEDYNTGSDNDTDVNAFYWGFLAFGALPVLVFIIIALAKDTSHRWLPTEGVARRRLRQGRVVPTEGMNPSTLR